MEVYVYIYIERERESLSKTPQQKLISAEAGKVCVNEEKIRRQGKERKERTGRVRIRNQSGINQSD